MIMSKNLAKSALWITVSEIIFNLSGYVIHSATGRILGPADYGRFSLVVTLTTMVIILIGRGIPTAMTKYLSEVFESKPEWILPIKRKAAFLQMLVMGVVTVIFFFLAPVIAWALKDPSLTPLFRLSSLIIPAFALTAFYVQYFIGLHKFNIQSILKVFRSLLRIIFVVSLAYFFSVGGAVAGYILAPLALSLVAMIIDKFWVAKKYPDGKDLVFDGKKLLNYAWQIVIFFLAYELFISIDLYLVKGILMDDHLTGIYNGALTVGRIPYYLFYALTVILLPVISKTTSENDHEKTNEVISKSLRLMFVLLVPAVILMSYFSEPMIRFFYGTKYLEAAFPMSILAYGVGFLTIFYVMCFVMNGAGKTKISMNISIFGFILNVILNYFFIKKFGIIGSASATTIASFIVMILMIFYLYKEFKIIMKFKDFFRIIFAGVILYLVAQFFPQNQWLFMAWGAILTLIYLLVLVIFGEINKNDWEFLKRMIFKKNKKVEINE